MPRTLTILPPTPEFVICSNGHVTNPWLDIDTRTGTDVTASVARDDSRNFRAGYASVIERGGEAWTKICRAARKLGGEDRTHQCRAAVVPLSDFPELEAAFRLGGGKAVIAIWPEWIAKIARASLKDG